MKLCTKLHFSSSHKVLCNRVWREKIHLKSIFSCLQRNASGKRFVIHSTMPHVAEINGSIVFIIAKCLCCDLQKFNWNYLQARTNKECLACNAQLNISAISLMCSEWICYQHNVCVDGKNVAFFLWMFKSITTSVIWYYCWIYCATFVY